MDLSIRPELGESSQRFVIKIGSAALAHAELGLNESMIQSIADDVKILREAGKDLVIVSSGAIQVGRKWLKCAGEETIDYLQACSAIGQPRLMAAYTRAFAAHGLICAQVLLTHEDIRNRRRNLNLQNMIRCLLQSGIVPILNENDSVSFAEITVGDNDQLAAMVSEMTDAHGLIILSTPDGLYPEDPGDGPARAIPKIAFNDSFESLNLVGKSAAGRGGMKTKLEAVRKLTPLGIPVIVGTFKRASPILSLIAGGGTFFEANPQHDQSSRQRWLVSSARLGAVIRIDRGAAEALRRRSSLLPSGITGIEGQFGRGDSVKIVCGRQVLGTGLVEYSGAELRRLQGCQSRDIEQILGYCAAKVAIHCDNLVLTEES